MRPPAARYADLGKLEAALKCRFMPEGRYAPTGCT